MTSPAEDPEYEYNTLELEFPVDQGVAPLVGMTKPGWQFWTVHRESTHVTVTFRRRLPAVRNDGSQP